MSILLVINFFQEEFIYHIPKAKMYKESLKSSIHTRIRSIDHRLTELVAMKAELVQLLSSWEECGGLKSA